MEGYVFVLSSIIFALTDDEDIDDSHECGRCKETFKSLDSFMNHKISCRVKRTDKKVQVTKPRLDQNCLFYYIKLHFILY